MMGEMQKWVFKFQWGVKEDLPQKIMFVQKPEGSPVGNECAKECKGLRQGPDVSEDHCGQGSVNKGGIDRLAKEQNGCGG